MNIIKEENLWSNGHLVADMCVRYKPIKTQFNTRMYDV